MRRRLFRILSLLSLLMCILVVTLWATSLVVGRGVCWRGARSGFGVVIDSQNFGWSELSIWYSRDNPALHPLKPSEINECAGFGTIAYYLGFKTPDDGNGSRMVVAKG